MNFFFEGFSALHLQTQGPQVGSEASRCARAPSRTDMLARAMGITRVEDLPDRDHTVWEVKEPATAKQPTWLLLL